MKKKRTRQELKVWQQKLLKRHEVVFRFIVIVAGQTLTLPQLNAVLLKSGYKKSSKRVYALVSELAEAELLISTPFGHENIKQLYATLPAVQYVVGPKGRTVTRETNNETRKIKTQMRIYHFMTHYVAALRVDTPDRLKHALENIEKTSDNYLNGKNYLLYSAFAQPIFYRSYANFEQTISEQLAAYERYLKQRSELRAFNLGTGHDNVDTEFKFDNSILTLEHLRKQEIYITNLRCIKAKPEEKSDFEKVNIKVDGKCYVLMVEFYITVSSYNTSWQQITKRLIVLDQYVMHTFKGVTSGDVNGDAFIKTQIDVIVMCPDDCVCARLTSKRGAIKRKIGKWRTHNQFLNRYIGHITRFKLTFEYVK